MNTLMLSSRKENGKSCAETSGTDQCLNREVGGLDVTVSAEDLKTANAPTEGAHIPADKSTDHDVLRVMVATPLGQFGRGGIDRLTDLIVESIEQRKDLDVEVERLVTRGEKRWWPVVYVRALIKIGIAMVRRDVDLLHIQLAWGGSIYRKLMIAALARYFGVPYVVHLHGGRFGHSWESAGKYLVGKIDRLFMESAAIIVLGQCWATLILDRLPGVKDKMTILPNTTTSPSGPKRCRADGEPIQITFLGYVGPGKGVPELIDAFGKLSERADWSAIIAGRGELDQSRSHAQRLGIADRVEIPGWLGPDETRALLRRTDILVLPSFVENLPMVVIEGFAYGLAVVATPVGAVPEVIDHGRNGLLVPVGNVEALAAALHRLLEDGELRRSLGEAARRDYAERFDISTYITRLVSTWRKAARS